MCLLDILFADQVLYRSYVLRHHLLLSVLFSKMFTCSFSLQNEWTDNVIGFHMPTYRACKNLWKTCVEYHTFYRFVSNGYVINFLWRAVKVDCLKLESGLLSLKISRFPPFNLTPRFGKMISLSNC